MSLVILLAIKTHGSESQGQEEVACIHDFEPMRSHRYSELRFENAVPKLP